MRERQFQGLMLLLDAARRDEKAAFAIGKKPQYSPIVMKIELLLIRLKDGTAGDADISQICRGVV